MNMKRYYLYGDYPNTEETYIPSKENYMIKPNLCFIPFDRDSQPDNLAMGESDYLVLIADYGHNPTENTVPEYYIDTVQAYGDYIDDFWNTSIDWKEGNVVHVVGYCNIGATVEVEKEVKVAYLCDGHACTPEKCTKNVYCRHTLDISHAKSFDEVNIDKYVEHDCDVCEC